MAAMTQCPDCATWNPPKATRCRTCGAELRGPDISFEGPPTGAPRPRSPDEERAASERKAAALAESMKAERERKREEERTRKEYLRRKEQHEQEVQRRRERDPGAPEKRPLEPLPKTPPTPSGVASPPTVRGPRLSRVSTYVTGLDQALGGGLPAGFVIVIGGTPGTLKSSLAFWILVHNAREGRRGLYIACEENSGGLLRQMEALGIDLAGVSDRLKVLDAPLLRKALRGGKGDWLPPLRTLVERARAEGDIDFLVIDSLEGLEAIATFEPRRRELFRLFEWLRDLGVTTFVVGERPDYMVQGTVLQPRYDEDFLADGVLNLRLHPISDLDVQRRLRIVKLRGTRHETAYLALHVGDGEFQVSRMLSA